MTSQLPGRAIRRPRDPREEILDTAPDASAAPSPEPAIGEAAPSEHRARPAAQPPRPEPAGARMDGEALLAELDALNSAELAALLGGVPQRFKAGDRVTGTVVRVGGDAVFVDIGAKSEALLDRSELEGPPPALGDRLTAFVLSTGERGIRLARRLSGHAGQEALAEAREAEIPVEGRVESRNTGGYVVRIAGVNAFCPLSQIDRHVDPDPDVYLGKSYSFRVVDIRGRDVVVSRRDVMEEEAAAAAKELWSTLKEGDILDGVVTSVRDFGVFVDVGGLDGLAHKSELGWDADASPPARGERVKVRVLSVDRDHKRLSLTLKDDAVSPWGRVGVDFVEGGIYPAKVIRLAPFGAFVSLAPGVEGLVHVSNLSANRVEQPSEVVKPGDTVNVRVLSIDDARKRLELGVKQADENAADYVPPPPRAKGAGGGGQGSFGTMADLLKGVKVAAPEPAKPARGAGRRR